MIKNFTTGEMLNLWCARRGILPLFSTDVEDETGIRASIEMEIEAWYADMLRKAPVELLPVENLVIESSVKRIDDDILEIKWPERGVRPVSLQFTNSKSVIRTFHSPGSDIARLQRYPITRAGADCPVAVAGTRSLRVYGAIPKSADIEELMMVARPADGSFSLDPALLKP